MTPPGEPALRRQLLRTGFVTVALLCAVAVVGSGPALAQETDDKSVELAGNGTEENPYEITTVEEFSAIEDDMDAQYVLERDINITEVGCAADTEEFCVIGHPSREKTFTGTFDGQNHTIETPDDSQLAYLIHTNNGTIRDLRVNRELITEVQLPLPYDPPAVGVVVENNGIVSNVTVVGGEFGDDRAGGIVGTNRGRIVGSKLVNATVWGKGGGIAISNQNGTIADSAVVNATVNYDGDAGGIAAHSRNGTIEGVTVTGTIHGTTVGGIVGYANDTSIRDVTVSGTIDGETAGGIAGQTTDASLTNVTVDATVEGDTAGGMIGNATDTRIELAKTTARVDGVTAGGLIGVASDTTVAETVVAGRVTGTGQTGGIIGSVEIEADRTSLEATYWDREATGQRYASGNRRVSALSSTTEQMTGLSAVEELSELDFITDWRTTEGYPEPAPLAGNGTAEDPYVIRTTRHLLALGEQPDAHYVLENDIDASETAEWDTLTDYGTGWDPIHRFTGVLDGQNHSIRGLTIDRPDPSRIGFIGTNSGTIRDLELLEPTFETRDGRNHVWHSPAGLVVGVNYGTISGVTVTDGYIINREEVGGIAGNNTNGTLSDVTVRGTTVEAEGTGGGIAGQNYGTIEDARVGTSTITASREAGGLVGEMPEGRITRGFVTGTVSGESAGGVVGSAGNVALEAVGTTATVRGETAAGGLLAEADGVTVVGGISAGPVSSESGLMGAVAAVFGNDRDTMGTVYFDRNRTGQTHATGGGNGTAIGLSTAEMIGPDVESKMPELDFEETWILTDGYPALRTDGDAEFRETVRVRSAELADRVVVSGNATQFTLTVENLQSDQTVYRPEVVAGNRSLDAETVVLSPGEQRSLATTVNLTQTGTMSIGVDRTQYETLAVVAEPTPSLVEIDAPDRVAAGEQCTISAVLENAAGVAINTTVGYEAGNQTRSREISVGPDGTTAGFDLVRNETGEITHTVTVRDESRTASTEIRESPSADVSSVKFPEPVTAGEKFTIEVALTNTGGVEMTAPVTLEVGDETLDQREVRLAPGETTVELIHSIDDEGTTELRVETPADQQTLQVSVESDGGSQDSTDSSDDSGPGFGVGAAVVALVSLVVAGRYRAPA
ncbi:GLUG motif-containing protein [Halovenus sp. HT40]|uniref:GLUG motif-containing protein n=1 Tax=Halovenus sp. HT40 TaxID=3126691 RepID=UPI00300E78B3